MKNKILYKEVDESNLDINIYTIHINNNGEIFWSNFKLDSVQYEIYKQKDQDSILLKMIDRNKYEFCNNISKHPNIKNFLQDKNILNDVRNYKLNKIID